MSGFECFEAWREDEQPGGEAERRALKQRAIALLARREHSRAELKRKLLATPLGQGRSALGTNQKAHHSLAPNTVEQSSCELEPDGAVSVLDPALDDSFDLSSLAVASVGRRRGQAAQRQFGGLGPQGGRRRQGGEVEPLALPSPALVDAVLDELAELKLLSDRRMAEALVRSGSARFGAARISQNLQRKGVEEGLIAEVIEPLAGSETDRAREVWQRRFGRAPVDMKERAKQYRFLLARGFASSVVGRVVPSVGRRPDDDEDWGLTEG
ncbi:MAG: regulatory protein RecX [Lautropia sp.]|nr:regulatory protein RecX [Lautropia sp.]